MKTYFLELTDKRIGFVSYLLKKKGYIIRDFESNLNEIKSSDIIILSPAYRWEESVIKLLPKNVEIYAGNISEDLKKYLKNFDYYNYFDDEDFITRNAEYTAQAFLVDLMQTREKSFCEEKFLITGNGRVAKSLWALFFKLGIDFECVMRNDKERSLSTIFSNKSFLLDSLKSKISKYDVIINTVPSKIFNKEIVSNIKESATIFELASIKSLEEYNLSNYKISSALPSRFLAKSAGNLIYEKIFDNVKEKK